MGSYLLQLPVKDVRDFLHVCLEVYQNNGVHLFSFQWVELQQNLFLYISIMTKKFNRFQISTWAAEPLYFSK